MDKETKRAIWNVLVDECDIFDSVYVFKNFSYQYPECAEYRFNGNQGFGGKIWAPGSMFDYPAVTCYPEDDSPERKAARTRANDRLKDLWGNG